MENMMNSEDPLHLVDNIVFEVKSQGLFDRFRKDCLSDVDTKPAYQNLRQRVESSVSNFLKDQKWSTDLNKNHVREKLRKNITDSGYLETGVERIVDQVVNPKISTIFLPQIEQVVCKYLGFDKLPYKTAPDLKFLTNTNGNLKVDTDLLPTDLEAVSPDSDPSKSHHNSNENLMLEDGLNESTDKIDDFESPPFEPLEGLPLSVANKDESNDSHLSEISGLTSQDSVNSDLNIKEESNAEIKIEVSNVSPKEKKSVIKEENSNSELMVDTISQDSLSQVSSNSRLSIITHSESPKLEISESTSQLSESMKIEDDKNKNMTAQKLPTTFDMIKDIKNEMNNVIKDEIEIETNGKLTSDEIKSKGVLIQLKNESKNEIKQEFKGSIEDLSQNSVKDSPKETPKNSPKDSSKDSPRESYKSTSKDSSSKYKDHSRSSSSSKHKHHDKDRDRKRYSDSKSRNSSDKSSSSKYRHHSSSSSRDASFVSDRQNKDDNDKKNIDSDSNHSSKRDRSKDHSKHSSSKSSASSSSKSSLNKLKDDRHYSSTSLSKSRNYSKDRRSDHRSSSSKNHSSSKDRLSSSSSSSRDRESKKSTIENSDKKKSRQTDDHSSARDRNNQKRRSTDGDSNDGSNSRFNFSNVASNDISIASSATNSTENSSTSSPTSQDNSVVCNTANSLDRKDIISKPEICNSTDSPKTIENAIAIENEVDDKIHNNAEIATEKIDNTFKIPECIPSHENRPNKFVFDNTTINGNFEIVIGDSTMQKSFENKLSEYSNVKRKLLRMKNDSPAINFIDFRYFSEDEILQAEKKFHKIANDNKIIHDDYEKQKLNLNYDKTAYLLNCDKETIDLFHNYYENVLEFTNEEILHIKETEEIKNITNNIEISLPLESNHNTISAVLPLSNSESLVNKIEEPKPKTNIKKLNSKVKLFRENNQINLKEKLSLEIMNDSPEILLDITEKLPINELKRKHNEIFKHNNNKKTKIHNARNIVLNLNISQTDSPVSLDSEELNGQIITEKRKHRGNPKTSQCYTSDDLYKPRTVFGQRSRRRGMETNDILI